MKCPWAPANISYVTRPFIPASASAAVNLENRRGRDGLLPCSSCDFQYKILQSSSNRMKQWRSCCSSWGLTSVRLLIHFYFKSCWYLILVQGVLIFEVQNQKQTSRSGHPTDVPAWPPDGCCSCWLWRWLQQKSQMQLITQLLMWLLNDWCKLQHLGARNTNSEKENVQIMDVVLIDVLLFWSTLP